MNQTKIGQHQRQSMIDAGVLVPRQGEDDDDAMLAWAENCVTRWLAELHPRWRTFTLDAHGRSEGERIGKRTLEGIAKGRAARLARES